VSPLALMDTGILAVINCPKRNYFSAFTVVYIHFFPLKTMIAIVNRA
jgi:hypothetical protein